MSCEPSENEFYFLSSQCWSVPTKHRERVSGAILSDDGSLAVTSAKNEIFLWKTDGGNLSFVKRLSYVAYSDTDIEFPTFDRLVPSVPIRQLPFGEVDFMTMSPSNEFVFIYEFAFNKNTATLFSINENKIEWVLDNSASDKAFIAADVNASSSVDHTFKNASFSADGELVAIAYFGRIEIVSVKDGTLVQTIPAANEHFNFASFSPTSTALFVLTNNNTAFLWDINATRKKQGYILLGNGKYADFDSKGEEIVISLEDKPLQVIDLATSGLSTTGIASGSDFVQFGESGDKKYIVPFSSYANDILVYPRGAQQVSKVFKHQDRLITTVAVSQNANFILAGDETGFVTLWDMNTNGIYDKTPPKPLNPRLSISQTGFTVDWETNGEDNENIQYFHFSHREEGTTEWTTQKIAYSGNHTKTLNLNTKNLTKYFFQIQTEGYNGKLSEYAEFEGDSMLGVNYENETIHSLIFRDDFFLASGSGGYLDAFKIEDKEVVRVSDFKYDSPFLSADLHPFLPQVIAGSTDGRIVTMNISITKGLEQTHLTNTHSGSIDRLKYSHNGNVFALSNKSNEVKLGESATGEIVYLYNQAADEITSLVFSRSDDKVIYSSKDGYFRGWSTTEYRSIFGVYTASKIVDMDISDNDVLYTIHAPLEVAPLDSLVTVPASLSCAILMWDMNGDPIGKYSEGLPENCSLTSLDVSHDGRYMLVVTSASTPLILDTHKKRVIDMDLNIDLPTFNRNIGTPLHSMKFSQDENHIILHTQNKDWVFVLITDNYIKP